MQLKELWRKHPFIVQTLIMGAILTPTVYIATLLVDVVINSNEMLQSIIQADATILGFFGIIAAYMLASYDSRLDRLEQQHFDLTLGDIDL